MIREEEAEEEVAVCRLLVVSARDDFLWATSECLGLFLLDFEFLTVVIVGCGCSY